MHSRRKMVRLTLGAAGTGIVGGVALAQPVADWPSRSVRIVCPFAPGGAQDNMSRRLSAKLSEYLGQSFVIDNRTGAGGAIAAENVAKAPPDGYSVLQGGISSHAIAPHLYARLPYNPFTELEPVVWIGTQPNLLCCHPNFPHDTIAKLIAAAKAEPGKISYGGSGLGTSPALTMELFKQYAGIDLTFVSYRGGAAAVADVLAGHIPLCTGNIDTFMGQVSAGKLKAVASTGAQRSPAAPHTPTFAESGFPDLVVTSWTIFAVPPAAPDKAKEQLRTATEKAVQSPDVIESMRQGGFEPGLKPLEEVNTFIKAEYKRWGEVIRSAGIKPE